MSRRYAHQKTDANHASIVAALRKVGCSVTSLASVGGGCPDLLVGLKGKTWLFEVKDGRKVPSARKLNEAELAWFGRWRGGRVAVVESVEQALAEVLGPAAVEFSIEVAT